MNDDEKKTNIKKWKQLLKQGNNLKELKKRKKQMKWEGIEYRNSKEQIYSNELDTETWKDESERKRKSKRLKQKEVTQR